MVADTENLQKIRSYRWPCSIGWQTTSKIEIQDPRSKIRAQRKQGLKLHFHIFFLEKMDTTGYVPPNPPNPIPVQIPLLTPK